MIKTRGQWKFKKRGMCISSWRGVKEANEVRCPVSRREKCMENINVVRHSSAAKTSREATAWDLNLNYGFVSLAKTTGSWQGVEGTFELELCFEEAYRLKSTIGSSARVLGSKETARFIIARHLSVFYEQDKHHMINWTSFTSSMEEANQLPRERRIPKPTTLHQRSDPRNCYCTSDDVAPCYLEIERWTSDKLFLKGERRGGGVGGWGVPPGHGLKDLFEL